MNKYTLEKKFVLLLVLFFVALSAMGLATVGRDRAAEATSYSQTDFAVTGYDSFVEVLGYADRNFSGKTIHLFCDIDLSRLTEEDRENFYFPSFAGTFEGNGHIVSGCTENTFGTIAATGTVKDVVFTGCALTSSVALADTNRGVVSGVTFYGKQTVASVDGVVKNNYGTMSNVASYLDVTVSSANNVYLLAGPVNGTLSDSFFAGSLNCSYYTGPWQCSAGTEQTVVYSDGNDQTTVLSVTSCQCDVLGVVRRNGGETAGLTSHAPATMPASSIDLFDALGSAYADLLGDFTIANSFEAWLLTENTTEYDHYSAFFHASKDLFGNSALSLSRNASGMLASGAVVGISDPFLITAGSDHGRSYADYQTVIARLFGYDDASTFVAHAAEIANFFLTNAAGASTSLVADRLAYNGAVYTASGSFVLPFVFKSASYVVPACVILDANDVLTVWLGDTETLFAMTNFENNIQTSYIESYGRCSLFEYPSTTDAYSVQTVDNGNGTYTKTTMYEYLDIYPYGGGNVSNGTVTGCAVFAEIQTNALPVSIYPYVQDCSDCSGVYCVASSWGEQPTVTYASAAKTQDVDVVASGDKLFTGTLSSYLIAPVRSATDSYQTVCYNVGGYVSPAVGTLTKTIDGGGNVADDFTSWTPSGFNFIDGYYPVQETFLLGGDSSPIQLSCAEDVSRLRMLVRKNGNATAYAILTAPIDYAGREQVCALIGDVFLNISGGYPVYNGPTELFGDGFTLGAFVSTDRPDQITEFFGTVESVSAVALTKGSGTQDDPYVIESAGQLVEFLSDGTKNAANKYAVLSTDIVLNARQNIINVLSQSSTVLNATLDGCGHTLFGLCFEPFVGTVAGTLKNLNIYTIAAEFMESAAAVCLTNNGLISDVKVYGSGAYGSAFVTVNNGTITRSKNELAVEYAFCTENNGMISYCINAASSCLYFDGGDGGGCVECISACDAGYRFLNGDDDFFESAGYLALEENGYDMNVFAYETGTAVSVLPVLRVYGGSYKTETEIDVDTQPATVSFGDSYITGDFIDPDEPNVILSWAYTYGGVTTYLSVEDMDDYEIVKEVGTYVLTVSVAETATTLPVMITRSFDVVKTDCPIKASNVTFNGLTGANGIIYTGRSVSASAVELDPASDSYVRQLIETYGFSFTYSYTQGGNAIAATDIVDVGTYGQTFVASSKNYKDITRTARSIEIKKAPLSVTVTGSAEVRYGYNLSFTAFGAESVFLGKDYDNGMTLQSVVSDYSTRFQTDYVVGQNAGTTANVWFSTSGITLRNYYFTATSFTGGAVTVTKAPIAQGNITFYGATATENGLFEATYKGSAYTLAATGIPAGVGYEYNVTPSFTQAGDYVLTLTVDDDGSNDNYEELVLSVNVSIAKAELTLTAENVEKYYGYAVSYSDFGYQVSGLCGSDTESVLNGLHLSAEPAFVEGAQPDYGTYEIAIFGDAMETDNYTLTTVSGTLSIVKIPLTTLYQNNVSGSNTDFDDRGKTYDGVPFDLSTIVVTYFQNNGITVQISYAYTKGGVAVSSSALNAGTYTVVATVTPPAESNYSAVTYSCDYVISKKSTSVRFVAATGYENNFSNGNYIYNYVPGGTVNYGTIVYCPYEADIPTGAEMQYGGDMAVYAGTYTRTVLYAGDQNFEGCSATATVTVAPCAVTVSVTRDYEYSAAAIIPEISVAGTTELSDASFSFSYTDGYNQHPNSLRDAGNYTLTLTCNNANYVLTQNSFPLVVAPLAVAVTLPSFSFTYGTRGEYAYSEGGVNYNFIIADNQITLKNYVVSQSVYTTLATDVVLDVRFRLFPTDFASYFPAGNYTAQGISQTNNLSLSISNTASVTVLKKTLTAQWFVDVGYGFEEVENEFAVVYNGVSRNGMVTYDMTGFAAGESMSDVGVSFSIVKRFSGSVISTILTVGEYACSLSLNNRLNYALESTTSVFIMRVRKKTVNIFVADATVEQRERFTGTLITPGMGDLVGKDADKSLSELEGYSLRYVCSYNDNIATASVGDTYDLNVQMSFDNYEPNVILNEYNSAATLTVTANPLPDYNLSGRTFTYDGTPKSLTISSLDSSVSVTYVNNGQINVGRYTVVAHIHYPSGREAVASADLVIVKATPTIALEPIYLVYKEGETLTNDLIRGKTYVGEDFDVSGVFTFKNENQLSAGEKKYPARFVPEDSDNVNPVNDLQVTVKCFVVDGRLLDPSGMYLVKDNVVTITQRITIELDRASIEEISDRVELYQNGSFVNYFIFDEPGEEKIEIRFDGETVYSRNYIVEISKEDKEPEEPLRINDNLLDKSNLTFDASKGIIYVGAGGGKLALNEKYLDEFDLYVDGVKVGSAGIDLSVASQYVTIEIRHKVIGTTYRKQFVLKGEDEIPAKEPEKSTGLPTYVYIIIAAAGALALGALLLLLLRGRH